MKKILEWIREYISKRVYNEIKEISGKEIEVRDIEEVLAYLSIFSKYEIAVPEEYLKEIFPDKMGIIKALLKIRELEKDTITNKYLGNPIGVRIPHSLLAKDIFRAYKSYLTFGFALFRGRPVDEVAEIIKTNRETSG